MKNHRRERTRRCAHCGQRFTINPRVGKRHRYCRQPACVKASHARSQKNWLRKNGGRCHFQGAENSDRVRSWREGNPKYWKRRTRISHASSCNFALTKRLEATLRFVALQDSIDTGLALKIGLISMVTGAALQDSIAKEIRRLILRGREILRGKSGR